MRRHLATFQVGTLLCFAFILTPCSDPKSTKATKTLPQGTSKDAAPRNPAFSSPNKRMARVLQELARTTDPARNEYANRQRLNALRRTPPPRHPQHRFQYETQVALETLNTGYSVKAAAGFRRLLDVLEASGQAAPPKHRHKLLHSLAISYLRQGEQENCIAHHNPDTCLFPLAGAGIHQQPEGARAAFETYTKILKSNPKDLSARWLLNVSGMAAGLYPKNIPKQWLIRPKAFESDASFPRFEDIAQKQGLAINSLAGGAVFDDFTGDGRLDLFVSSWGQLDQLRFFVATTSGFQEKTKEAGLIGLTGGLNIIHADFDNDGDNDLFVLRGAWRQSQGNIPNSLLRNEGNGKFTDVTYAAGLGTARPTQTAVWADFDNDGWLDLFIGNESDPSAHHPSELFRNNGNGTFTDVANSAQAAIVGYVKGVTAGDYDNDGRMDLYVSRLDSTNHLLKNQSTGPGRFLFVDVTKEAGVGATAKTFPTWFFDYNNDGWLDLLVFSYQASPGDVAADYLGKAHHGARPHLFENRGDGRFRDRTAARGLNRPLLAMGCNFGDLDNDGWIDFYVGTGDPNLTSIMPNRMFRNIRGRTFQDITTAGGFGHLQKGHGVAFVDFDEDGDQDVYAVMGGAYDGDRFTNVLFQNPGTPNNWIKLDLEGKQSNRSAIGARIELQIGKRKIHSIVTSGGSFGGSSLRVSLGIGKAQMIDKIKIVWPSGRLQELSHVEAKQLIHIKEPSEP
jgi:hypothetical protein